MAERLGADTIDFFSDLEGPISTGDGPLAAWTKYVGDGDSSMYTGPYYGLTDGLLDKAQPDVFRPGPFDAAHNQYAVLAHLIDREVTSEHLLAALPPAEEFVPGIREQIEVYRRAGDKFSIVSTAYKPIAVFLADQLGVPAESVYSTRYPEDAIPLMTPEEKTLIAAVENNLANLPEDHAEAAAYSENVILDFAKQFWKPDNRALHHIQRTVAVVGGRRKTKVVRAQTGNPARTVYIGDGVTDHDVIPAVHRWGGLSIAFNGNNTVVPNATVAIASNNAEAVSPVVASFRKGGRAAVKRMVVDLQRGNAQRQDAQYHWVPGLRPGQIEADVLPAHAFFRNRVKNPGLAGLR